MNALRTIAVITAVVSLGAGCGGSVSPQGPEEEIGPPMRSALKAPPASPTSPLAAFALSNGNPRVYHLDQVSHVSELSWKPGWYYDDATSGASAPPELPAPPAAADSAVAALAMGADLPRVYYVTSSPRHVHELWWDGLRWHDHDLCAATGAADVAPNSALVGVKLDANNVRVYYVSAADLHVRQLAWTGSSWSAQDLTSLSNGQSAGRADALAAFAVTDGSGSSFARVYFVGSDRHVYELWAWGTVSGWGCHDLVFPLGAPNVQDGTGLTGVVVNGNRGRVYYVSADAHVIELNWTGQDWTFSDLTTWARFCNPTPDAAPSTALTSFVVNGDQPRVYFISNTTEVYELWTGGASWCSDSVTARALAPAPKPTSHLAGMALTGASPAGQDRVYYLGSDNDVYELGWNGTGWGHEDVTNMTN
jgi:fucose-binding lectin